MIEDTPFGGFVFKKDGMIMIPGRPGHFAPEIFGDDAHLFVPDRFIRDISTLPGEKKNPGTKAVKPFGGGSTLCPGRFLANYEILSYVALVVWRFDLELVDKSGKAAIPNTSAPTVGVYSPDRDVQVKLRIRQPSKISHESSKESLNGQLRVA